MLRKSESIPRETILEIAEANKPDYIDLFISLDDKINELKADNG